MDPESEASENQAGRPRPPRDTTAFLAVLAVGTLLILEGHVATADLVTDVTALAALYASFHRS